MIKFLRGKDYPWLCESCKGMVDEMALLAPDMEDTDDNEAPLNWACDNNLMCGGRECKNGPRKCDECKAYVRRGQEFAHIEAAHPYYFDQGADVMPHELQASAVGDFFND